LDRELAYEIAESTQQETGLPERSQSTISAVGQARELATGGAPQNSARSSAQSQSAELQMLLAGQERGADPRKGDVRKVAAQGVAASGQSIPYQTEMEEKFGASFSNVTAHVDPTASAANQAIGSEAYAMGNQIAFSESNPSREIGRS